MDKTLRARLHGVSSQAIAVILSNGAKFVDLVRYRYGKKYLTGLTLAPLEEYTGTDALLYKGLFLTGQEQNAYSV